MKKKISIIVFIIAILLIKFIMEILSLNSGVYVNVQNPVQLSSYKYVIDNTEKYITNILPNTTVSILKDRLIYEGEIKVYDSNGKEVDDETIVVTYMSAKLDDIEYILVVKGDITGTGYISETDLTKLKLHLIDAEILTGASLKAADINSDNEVTLTDYSLLKQIIIGTINLEEQEDTEPILVGGIDYKLSTSNESTRVNTTYGSKIITLTRKIDFKAGQGIAIQNGQRIANLNDDYGNLLKKQYTWFVSEIEHISGDGLTITMKHPIYETLNNVSIKHDNTFAFYNINDYYDKFAQVEISIPKGEYDVYGSPVSVKSLLDIERAAITGAVISKSHDYINLKPSPVTRYSLFSFTSKIKINIDFNKSKINLNPNMYYGMDYEIADGNIYSISNPEEFISIKNSRDITVSNVELNGGVMTSKRAIKAIYKDRNGKEVTDTYGSIEPMRQGIRLSKVANVIIDNCKLNYTTSDGIHITSSSKDILIKNSELKYNARLGLTISSGTYITVENTTIAYNGWTGSFKNYAAAGGVGMEFEENNSTFGDILYNNVRFINNYGNHMYIADHPYAFDTMIGEPSNIIVENCLFYGNNIKEGVLLGNQVYSINKWIIRNSIFVNPDISTYENFGYGYVPQIVTETPIVFVRENDIQIDFNHFNVWNENGQKINISTRDSKNGKEYQTGKIDKDYNIIQMVDERGNVYNDETHIVGKTVPLHKFILEGNTFLGRVNICAWDANVEFKNNKFLAEYMSRIDHTNETSNLYQVNTRMTFDGDYFFFKNGSDMEDGVYRSIFREGYHTNWNYGNSAYLDRLLGYFAYYCENYKFSNVTFYSEASNSVLPNAAPNTPSTSYPYPTDKYPVYNNVNMFGGLKIQRYNLMNSSLFNNENYNITTLDQAINSNEKTIKLVSGSDLSETDKTKAKQIYINEKDRVLNILENYGLKYQ